MQIFSVTYYLFEEEAFHLAALCFVLAQQREICLADQPARLEGLPGDIRVC